MNRKTSVVVLLLLVMTLALTGTMMPEQAQAKTAALPGCKYVGCTGGSDLCFTLSVVVKGVTLELNCYGTYR
jgi:hypothetical protein